jgi:hypothetical protein
VNSAPEAIGESYFEWAARLFDPAGRHAKPEALRGIRVLDLSVIIFGPAPACRMTRTPPRLKVPGRPPGYHTAPVYARHLGLGPERLGELRARGVV